MTENQQDNGDGTTTRPCGWCAKPVPQRTGAGRRREYCPPPARCAEEAKRARAARRAAGGIGGDVAAAEDLVERLDAFVARLADGLATELTPAAVQAATSQAQASAALVRAQADQEVQETRRAASLEVERAHADRDSEIGRASCRERVSTIV